MEQKLYIKKEINKNIDKGLDRLADHPIGGPTMWTVANSLTIFRIFISPVFLLLYLQHDALGITAKGLPYALLLGISELSDAFDGLLARKYNQVTDLGKILDPMADSISRISVFLTFTQPPVNVPLVCVFLFLYRDSVISTLRTICALRGFALCCWPKWQDEGCYSGSVLVCYRTSAHSPFARPLVRRCALAAKLCLCAGLWPLRPLLWHRLSLCQSFAHPACAYS